MASCLQQVASSAVVPNSAWVSSRPLPWRSLFNASPISQPWWKDLSQVLKVECSALRRKTRRSTFIVRASEEAALSETEAEIETVTELVEPQSPPKRVKDLMKTLEAEAKARLSEGKVIPSLRPGDVVSLRLEVPENKRRVSVLRGIVISVNKSGVNTTFRIRRVMAGVGVEMVFPLYSPNIKELKVVGKRKARRAKLYYLRDKIARLSSV